MGVVVGSDVMVEDSMFYEPRYSFFGGRDEWVNQFPCVVTWLERVGKNKQQYLHYRNYAYRFFRWLWEHGGDFAGKTPDELLRLQEAAVGRNRFAQLNKVQFFVNEVLKGTRDSKNTILSVIRSFYAHNYVELPRDPRFRVKETRPPVLGELNRGELKEIILRADRPYRVALTIMFMGFMGYREFHIFNTSENAIKQVLTGAEVVKVYMSGRKRGRPFYTFVGGDGLKELRDYLEKERGSIGPGDSMIVNKAGNPLTQGNVQKVFIKVCCDVGIIELNTPTCIMCSSKTRKIRRNHRVDGKRTTKTSYLCLKCGHVEPASETYRTPPETRYGAHPHELRDLAKSNWWRSQPEKWLADFFMGHIIDTNRYNKAMKIFPDWMEEQYLNALPWLNILSEDPETVPVKEINQIRTELAQLKSQSFEMDILRSEVKELKDMIKLIYDRPEIVAQIKNRNKK